MTEEIIIDGVNVAGCEYHYTNLVDTTIYHGCSIYEQTNELGYQQDTICIQNPDCYYKQLQRLKQENEKLKEEIDKTRYNRLEMYESFEKECNNYRKTLEKIREIADQTNCKNKLTEYTVADLSTMQNKFSEILNKINEVLQ